MSRPARFPAFEVLLALTVLAFGTLLYWMLRAPIAQEASGGLAQKIFYYHAPAAYAMYLSGIACFLGSAAYLARETDGRNALARAGAECAVFFGSMMLVSGPLWAKKAWGVYWTWDPRLTTTLLSFLVYVAVVVLRRFSGEGSAERKFAAAFGVLGTVNLPIIHYSVRKWGGNHPTVVTSGGGGLGHPDMKIALALGFLSMTLLAVLLLWSRSRLATLEASLARTEEEAYSQGLAEDA